VCVRVCVRVCVCVSIQATKLVMCKFEVHIKHHVCWFWCWTCDS